MGRLARLKKSWPRHLRRSAFAWLPPAALTLLILFGIHSTVKADPAPTTSELAQYLQTHSLDVAAQVQGDYQQVYYTYNDQQIFITGANYNHTNPMASGEYVTWEGQINGATQIFLYDVLTSALTQITSIGTNVDPYLYQNTITWETWDVDHWQVMFYDGFEVRQITSGANASVQANSNGQKIIYAEQLAPNSWRAQAYDIATAETTTIREGDTASTGYPRFASDGSIVTAFQPY